MDGGHNLMFPRLYDNATCPLPGYEAFTFRVLLNPTGAEKEDWAFGNLGNPICQECQALRTESKDQAVYCGGCMEARTRFGRALLALFGESQVKGFDFSSAAAALASLEQDDVPDELMAWIYLLPQSLWYARSEDLKKKLFGSSPTAS